jgi:hypothetical protein
MAHRSHDLAQAGDFGAGIAMYVFDRRSRDETRADQPAGGR